MDEAEEGARLESGLARELIRCEAVKENLHHKKRKSTSLDGKQPDSFFHPTG